MRRAKMTLLGVALCVLGASPAMGQQLIDDFDYTTSLSGYTRTLDDTEMLETNLETGLPDAFWFGWGAMGKGTGLIADDFSGTRHVQVDWQGHLSPAPGDFGRVRINRSGSGVAQIRAVGDPRVVLNYGRAAGLPYAFGPFDFTGLDVFKLELAAPKSKPLTFGLFLWGEIHGITQLWSSAPFQLAAGDTSLGYDIPEHQQFTAWNGSEFHYHHTVGDILENLTGISLVWGGGDQNPDVTFNIDYMFMDLFGSLEGDLNANGVVDGDDCLPFRRRSL